MWHNLSLFFVHQNSLWHRGPQSPWGRGVLVDPVNSCSVKYYSNLPGIIQYRERLMGMNRRSTVTHSLLTFLLCVDGLQMDRESTMQLLLDLSNVSV